MKSPTPLLLQQTFEQAANMLRVTSMSREILQLLAQAFAAQWATYWQVDRSSHVLRAAVTWSEADVPAQSLERDTKRRFLTLSEGVAGQVWRSGQAVWTSHLVDDMCLPRSLDAKEAGFQGGIWFAVRTESTVYGVIEILGKNTPVKTQEALLAVEQGGFALGNIVARSFGS